MSASRYAAGLMRVAILINPSSGRGRGAALKSPLSAAVRAAGHEPIVAQVGRNASSEDIERALKNAQAVVVCGGDGTLHHATPMLLRAGAALYHYPLGTENLFARHFGMRPRHSALLDALALNVRTRVDVATITVHSPTMSASGGKNADTRIVAGKNNNESIRRHALLMVSIGPDGGIVRRIAAMRTGPISHATYVVPTLREVIKPSLPVLDVEVDGTSLVAGRAGWLVVANCREYGARLNPCPRASMLDGMLDVVFFPANTGAIAGAWAVRSRLRCAQNAVRAKGKLVRIASQGNDPPWQVDGEDGEHGVGPFEATVSVMPGVLEVLGTCVV